MERTKEILALAPFIALAIAITYLHGYWSFFDILAFPYLSFQELLAYSTAPLFGFVFFSLLGVIFGVVNSLARRGKEKSRWIVGVEDAGILMIGALLIYLDDPMRWIFIPVIGFGLVVPHLLRTPALESFRQTNPNLVLSSLLVVFLLLGSFGYGRTQAERLLKSTEPNAQVFIETHSEIGKLLGKLGAYYFFLDASRKVNILPESSVKRIEYRKELKHG